MKREVLTFINTMEDMEAAQAAMDFLSSIGEQQCIGGHVFVRVRDGKPGKKCKRCGYLPPRGIQDNAF